MKTSLILVLSIGLFLGCTSRSNTNNADSVGMGTEEGTGTEMGVSENNNNTWDQNRIKEFVDDAAASSLMEVQLGKIAQTKAMSQQVKDYAQMMVKDHSSASDKLKSAVQSLNLTLPTSMDQDHQSKVDDLNKKTGNDFDKDYIDKMVQAHKDDIDEFEQAQKNLPTGELRTWVENTLPVLRTHHTQAQTIQDQLKNNK